MSAKPGRSWLRARSKPLRAVLSLPSSRTAPRHPFEALVQIYFALRCCRSGKEPAKIARHRKKTFARRTFQERSNRARCRAKRAFAFRTRPRAEIAQRCRCWREHRAMVEHVAQLRDAGKVDRHRTGAGRVCDFAEEIGKESAR